MCVSRLRFPGPRRFDIACLGRLAVDLYAQQVGSRLEVVSSFAKYLGGSSANFAFGVAHPPDSVLSPIKLRRAGFADCEDTEDSLLHWIARMQAERFLPR